MDSGFQLLYSEFLVSGTNSIPHTNGFRDSGFVKLYYGFHMKIFPHSRIRITLNGAIRRNHCNEGTVCLLTRKFELKKQQQQRLTKKMGVNSLTHKFNFILNL